MCNICLKLPNSWVVKNNWRCMLHKPSTAEKTEHSNVLKAQNQNAIHSFFAAREVSGFALSPVVPRFSERTWRHHGACTLLPVKEAQSAVTIWARREEGAQARRNTTRAKMSSFSTKFGGYTMTQLNEFLEDDEKLLKMVQETDEVS